MSERLASPPAPGDLPEPREGERLTLEAGQVWARIFFHAGARPTTFDGFRRTPLAQPGRFDAFGADGVDGVLHGAIAHPRPAAGTDTTALGAFDPSAVATCLAEACQPLGVLDRAAQRTLVIAELTEPLVVLDVSSDWAARAGAGAGLSAAPRALTSRWAAAIAQRWGDLDGVAAISSVRPAGRALALWAPRAQRAVASSRVRLHRGLDDPLLHPALSWAAAQVDVVL